MWQGAFSPKTDSFLSMNLAIPRLFRACCLYVDHDQLVILSENCIHRVTVGTDGHLALQSGASSASTDWVQNSQAIEQG